MAEAIAKTEVIEVTLVLDEKEAGYLLDLLSAHVGGALINHEQPLGRIRVALEDARVARLYARNEATSPARYAALYE